MIEEKLNDYKQDVVKAKNLIYDLVELNPQLVLGCWVSALIVVLVHACKDSGVSYDEFRLEMDRAFSHYKSFYENKKAAS